MKNSTTKTFKCPLCPKKYVEKTALYNHMEKEHSKELNGLSPAHFYFDWKNKNTTHKGRCIQCKGETEFNENTERYDRLCSEKCKKAYREEFKKRMMNKYGKTTLTNDPEMQKKMLANRKISGTYIWSDGAKFTYTGTYERDCLEYLDKVLNMKSTDVLFPAPQVIKYRYNDKDHFYLPDGYLLPFNLIIEIKGSNNHYQKRDLDIQKTKEKALIEFCKKNHYEYIMILDKNYDQFIEFIQNYNNKE